MTGRADPGSGSTTAAAGDDGQDWPGRWLGRPREGAGSIARPGRRLLAVLVDWLLAMLVSQAFFGGDPWATLLVFGVVQVLLVGTVGFAVGHALLGMRVERVDGAWAGPGRALIRGVLLCLAVPPLIWDRDQRGLHDRAAGTVLVRR